MFKFTANINYPAANYSASIICLFPWKMPIKHVFNFAKPIIEYTHGDVCFLSFSSIALFLFPVSSSFIKLKLYFHAVFYCHNCVQPKITHFENIYSSMDVFKYATHLRASLKEIADYCELAVCQRITFYFRSVPYGAGLYPRSVAWWPVLNRGTYLPSPLLFLPGMQLAFYQAYITGRGATGKWCERRELNPQQYQILSLARMPIPPRSHFTSPLHRRRSSRAFGPYRSYTAHGKAPAPS